MAEPYLNVRRERKGTVGLKGYSDELPRWLAWVIWSVVAAGLGAWAFYAFMPARSTPEQASPADMPPASRGDSTGTRNAPPAQDANLLAPALAPASPGDRFKLVGVAVGGGGAGLALIAIDGRPARAFRVGAAVDGDIVLRQVAAGGATLGPRGGGAAISLQASLAPAAPTAPAPTSEPELESQAPIAGSALSPAALRQLGSKHPPLAQHPGPAPAKAADGTAESGDGKWTRPSVP